MQKVERSGSFLLDLLMPDFVEGWWTLQFVAVPSDLGIEANLFGYDIVDLSNPFFWL